jgi:hypothetical protein
MVTRRALFLTVMLALAGCLPPYAEAEQVLRRAYALDSGESDAIRDNLRLALAKSENSAYDAQIEQDYKVVRRGSSEYLIRKIP